MGLNISKLRKKMKIMDDNMGNGNDISWYKPKEGRNVVRLLPAKDGEDDFYKEVLIHYNLSLIGMEDNQLNCRKTDPEVESCPLCETTKVLSESDNDKDNDAAKKIKPTSRFYLNVCLNSKEDKDDDNYNEVLVWNCPQSVFREMLNAITDEDYIDNDGNSLILDPDEGYDFVIRMKGKGRKTRYDVNVRPKSSAVHIEDWEDKLNDLSNFGKTLSEKDMYKKIEGDDEDDDSDDESDDENEERPVRHHKSSSHKSHSHSDEEDEEDEEDEDEEEQPRKRHSSRNAHKSSRGEDEDEDDEGSTDDADESKDLEEDIKEHAKKISRGRHTRKSRRSRSDEEDEEDEDEDDPF